MLANNCDPVTVKQIAWLRVIPALHLLKAVRNGFRLRVLVPATLVLICLLLGPPSRFSQWPVSGYPLTLSPPQMLLPSFGRELLPVPLRALLEWPLLTGEDDGDPLRRIVSWLLVIVTTMIGTVAIARATSQDLCRRSRSGALSSLKYSLNAILSSLSATALAFVILFLLGLPLLLTQWIFGPDSSLRTCSGVVSAMVAIYAVLAAFAACVVFVGWLLSLAAIGTDGCDGADALSRGISYTLSEKLLTTVYVYLALVVCLLARLIATLLSAAAFQQLPPMMQQPPAPGRSIPLLDGLGRELLQLFPFAVQLGGFVSAVTIIYLLLRRRVDGIDLEETGSPPAAKAAAAADKPAAIA